MNPKPITLPYALRACFVSAIIPLSAFAQSAPAAATPNDELVQLSAFQVSATQTSAYQSQDANSAGRIRMPLIDTPESISVITRDFLNDIGAVRMLDVAQYVGGVSESTIPNRLDRLSIRGFQQDPAQNSQFVDGFRFSAVAAGYSQDQANMERIEIVKGPNAIIAAAGSPGGAVNVITKSPRFKASGFVRAQVGEFLTNRLELDSTGPLPLLDGKTFAYRVVGMFTDGKGYMGNQFAKAYYLAPSLTWRVGPATEVTLKARFGANQVSTIGLPIDPRIGPNDQVSLSALYPGLKPTSIYRGKQLGGLPGNSQSVSLEATHKFVANLESRLGGLFYHGNSNDLTGNISGNGIGGAVGNVNPTTGQYTPGTTWTVLNYGLATQTVTSAAPALPDFTNRTTGFTYPMNKGFNHDNTAVVQNDYVYKADLPGGVRLTTVAGWAATTHTYWTINYGGFTGPLSGTLDNPDIDTTFATAQANGQAANIINQKYSVLETTSQAHLSEVLRLFSGRLILSGSLSRYKYFQRMADGSIVQTNPLGTAVRAPAGYATNSFYVTPGLETIRGTKTTKSFGAVVKVQPNIAVFYGKNENVNPPTINNIGGTSKINQYGDQYEVGVKTSFAKDTISLTGTYFSIRQHNVFVYDLTSNTFLSLGDVTSKGTELEFNAKVNANINLLGQWSDYKARNSFGQRIRGVADQSRALAVRYSIREGSLKNLWFLVGTNFLGKRAGDNPGTININGASAKPGLVVGTVNGRTLDGRPVEPTFYLKARTIFSLNSGYTFNARWSAWLKIDNVLNQKYVSAALNRSTVFIGDPRAFTTSVTYKF